MRAGGEGPGGPAAPGEGKKQSTPVCCCTKSEIIRLHPSSPVYPALLIQKVLHLGGHRGLSDTLPGAGN